MQDLIGRQPDRVADAFGLQQLVDLRLGERRVGAEVQIDAALAVAGHNRLQDQAPVLGAVHVARPEPAALQVAELVEHEQRMVAGTAEVAIVGRAFLLAVGRALGAVHVEDDGAGRLAFVDAADPSARQIRERLQVGVRRQPLGLETPHLAARGGRTIEPLPANDRPHGGVAGEPFGVVHVLVARQPTEHRLAKQPAKGVARVLAASAVEEFHDRDLAEPQHGVQLTVGEQAAVRGDPGTVEFELDSAVESGSQRQRSDFTRRVLHDHAPSVIPNP